MKALVLGATGAIGKDLVEQLLKDDTFDRLFHLTAPVPYPKGK